MGFRPEEMGFRPEEMGFHPEEMGFHPEEMGFHPEEMGTVARPTLLHYLLFLCSVGTLLFPNRESLTLK